MKGYDDWKLASPDSNEVEIYETQKFGLFSKHYDNVIGFDTDLLKAEKMSFDASKYDSHEEYIEDVVTELAGTYGLSFDEGEAYEK